MIPIRDDQPRFSDPFVTYFLIAINTVIFLLEWALDPSSLTGLLYEFGMIPSHVAGLVSGAHGINPTVALVPMFTSMFLHGSWMHVIGNMWFLWIFGDNIEDYLGHFKYLAFYLGSGVAAALAQIVVNPFSTVPNVGASGAIAGVLGAYFILYPKARVLTWFPLFFFFHLPAWVMLGYWFVYQFLSGAATSITQAGENSGGIAFWAHVGGFVAGIVLIKIIPERPRRYRYGAW
ncbi:MAG: rhomboid family intramembrane serine protease [Acidobacteriia bacterium]|nr:rhomboid family intramembrane serine protease [Terriglobia bacterium]